MAEKDMVDLRWVLAVIRRWAWLVIGCAVLAMVLALGVTARMRPVYEATATLLVAPAGQSSNTSEYNTLRAGQQLALTYSQMLTGRSILQTAISRLGLDQTPEALAKKLKTEPVKDTQLLRVTARDSSPVQASLIANAVAETFTEYVGALQEDRYRGELLSKEAEIEALNKVTEETQSQLVTVSAKSISTEVELARLQGLLDDYRNTNRILQQDYQSSQLLVGRMKDSVTVVETARVPEVGAESPYTATVTLLVDRGGANLGTGYSDIQGSERPAETYAQIMTGRSVLEAAIAKRGDGQSPDALAPRIKAERVGDTQLLRLQVVQAPGEDPATTALLANAVAEAFVDRIQEMLGKSAADRLASLQDETARLSALIAEVQAEILAETAAKFQNESELARLQDALAGYRENYRVLQQDYEQFRLTASQASDSVVITERAYEPAKPTGNRVQYLVFATLVAVLVALGIAFLAEHLDESIKTSEDVTTMLGLDTIGMIEQFGKAEEKLIVASQPQSPAAEAFRWLAASIRRLSMAGQFHTVLVTSPSRFDGKSVVAANLAVAMAIDGLRVVLVDADLRLPQLHQYFGLSREHGLTDALYQGGNNGHLTRAAGGVRILTGGTSVPDPIKALSSPEMKKLLADLGRDQETDLVIIDSPPVLGMADATILAEGADGVLLVLRAGQTGRQPARRAVETLHQARAHLLGVVLNAVPPASDGHNRYYKTISKSAVSRSWLRKALRKRPAPGTPTQDLEPIHISIRTEA